MEVRHQLCAPGCGGALARELREAAPCPTPAGDTHGKLPQAARQLRKRQDVQAYAQRRLTGQLQPAQRRVQHGELPQRTRLDRARGHAACRLATTAQREAQGLEGRARAEVLGWQASQHLMAASQVQLKPGQPWETRGERRARGRGLDPRQPHCQVSKRGVDEAVKHGAGRGQGAKVSWLEGLINAAVYRQLQQHFVEAAKPRRRDGGRRRHYR